MGDRLWASKPFRYITSHLGQTQLFIPQGYRLIEHQPIYGCGYRGEFTCVGWQETLIPYGKANEMCTRRAISFNLLTYKESKKDEVFLWHHNEARVQRYKHYFVLNTHGNKLHKIHELWR